MLSDIPAGLVIMIIWFTFIGYLLLSGSKRVRQRAVSRNQRWKREYELIVSKGMTIGGIIVLCSIILIIISWIAG